MIAPAMKKAHYEILPEGEGYFGKLEGLTGVWADGDSLEACREELQEVLEEWIIVGLKKGHPIPLIESVNLDVREVARCRNWNPQNAKIRLIALIILSGSGNNLYCGRQRDLSLKCHVPQVPECHATPYLANT